MENAFTHPQTHTQTTQTHHTIPTSHINTHIHHTHMHHTNTSHNTHLNAELHARQRAQTDDPRVGEEAAQIGIADLHRVDLNAERNAMR